MLTDKENQLEIGGSGIVIKHQRKPVRIPWKEVLDIRFGIRDYARDVTANELYVYTKTQGSFCLPVDDLQYAHIDLFRDRVLSWWSYVRAERVRKALGG